jgi:hypothetical protein
MDTSPRYTKTWLADGRILCYRFEDTTTATIDAWASDLIQEIEAWTTDRPWRLLLDIRLHGNIVSTYALRRAREIAHRRPELPGRLAILIGSRLAAQIISIALRGAPNTFRRRSFFVSEALAIAWLLEQDDNADTS